MTLAVREYSTREVADIVGLSERRIRRWVSAGVVTPHKDARGRWRYSFQDLALLRTASQLLRTELSPNRITRTLRLLREQLPAGRPLSAVRILVNGRRVTVKDRLASWEPESRQGTLDFDVKALAEPIARETPPGPPPAAAAVESAATLCEAALDLELAGRACEARAAYEAALERDPALVAARINLGRLLHAAHRVTEAEAMYRRALELAPDNALAAFNLGVALEDSGRGGDAVDAYRRALEIDPDYADAHFNLSGLLEKRGDPRGALRHLSSFRRLMRRNS